MRALNFRNIGVPIPLWSAGLVVAIIFVCGVVTRAPLAATIDTNHPTMAVYFSLATIFPTIAIAIRSGSGLPAIARTGLGAVAVVAALFFLAGTHRFVVLPFAVLTFLFAWRYIARSATGPNRAAIWMLSAGTILTAWTVAAGLEYLTPLAQWLGGQAPNATSNQTVGVLFGATILVSLGIFALNDSWPPVVKIADHAMTGAMLAAILIAALRSDPNPGDILHLFFFVGPIELVRQGEWLLWDIPSQYGFGMILANAAIPAKSSYAALMVVTRVLLIASASTLFILLRAGSQSFARSLFAGVLAIAAVFFVAGLYFEMWGPEHFPSVGPMRFIWCYLLLLVAFAGYAGALSRRLALSIGSICWVLSCCWAAESAIYGSCVWLPWMTIQAWQDRGRAGVAAWYGLTLLIFASACAIISLPYLIALHRFPDWFAFIEFGLAYGGGFGIYPLAVTGAVWILVTAFVICAAGAIAAGTARRPDSLAVILAACGAQWSTMSYFVVRSHDNNVCNLLPINVAAIAIVLVVVQRDRLDSAVAIFVRCASAPMFAMAIALAFSETGIVARYLEPFESSQQWLHPTLASTVQPRLAALVAKTGLARSDTLMYNDLLFATFRPDDPDATSRLWMPAYPAMMFQILPKARQALYVQRFARRRRLVGYLIDNSSTRPEFTDPELRRALRTAYFERILGVDGPYTIYRYTPDPARLTR